MAKEIFKYRLNYWIDEQQLCKLDEVVGRLGLDRSEVARRAMAEGLEKFRRVRLPGSPTVQAKENQAAR